MRTPDLKKALLRSGFCLDSLPALRFFLRGLGTPGLRQLLIAARVKFTPDILLAIRASVLTPAEQGAVFSAAMNLFRSGPTFKTTSAGRAPLTDRAALEKAGPDGLIAEAGVSDGVSALGLLEARGGRGVLLTDRQDAFRYKDFGPFRVFYDKEDGAVSVKFLFLYVCVGLPPSAVPADARAVSLLNPEVEARFPGTRLTAFDIFTGSLPEKAAVIKCANVLNKAYFNAAQMKPAVANLLGGLRDGGWLLVSQSNPRYEAGEAYIALRRQGDRFLLAEELNGHELLADLRSPLYADLVLPGGGA
ncbi:MAG: hypothetical protein ACYC2I_01715 [Elusimicrobiales bacterium]